MSAPFVNSVLTTDVSPLAEAVIKPAFISYNTEPQLKESKYKCFIYSFLIFSVFRKYLLEKMVLNKRLHLVGNHTRFPKSLISGLSNGLYPGISDNYSLCRHTQTALHESQFTFDSMPDFSLIYENARLSKQELDHVF